MLVFSNLVMSKPLSPNHRMYNLYTKFVKILEMCKQFFEKKVARKNKQMCRMIKESEKNVVLLS